MCTGAEVIGLVGAFAGAGAAAAQASSASNQAKQLKTLQNKPAPPAKANKTQANADISKTLKNRQTTGSKVAKSPTLLTSGGSAGIQDSQLNLSKSLIGG